MNFNSLLKQSSLIFKGDERIKTYAESFVYTGNPDVVVIPRDWVDVSEILASSHAKKIPVTFSGSRTAMTGASIADGGVMIALERLNRVLDIGVSKTHGMVVARLQPGIILADLKQAVAEQGFFYPPDPTSFREAQLGGTIATNATGEDSLLYGPTRRYVRELKILTCEGKEKNLIRKKIPVMTTKNKVGYFLEGEEIDYFIGAEGTLGLITEALVEVLPDPREHFSALIPFSDFKPALEFVAQTVPSLHPRAMELIGPGAYEIFLQQEGLPPFPENTTCLIYLKLEYLGDQGREVVLKALMKWLEFCYHEGNSFLESVFLGETQKQKDDIREWRHHVPLMVNENNRKLMENGGGKISTDWWVPRAHLVSFMLEVFEESKNLGVDFLVFAHIGNGHPHWNYLTKNAAEKKRVESYVETVLRRVARLGGGVAGEHGIGKIHHNYLAIQHSAKTIQKMRELKTKWDPHWILGRNNLFSF